MKTYRFIIGCMTIILTCFAITYCIYKDFAPPLLHNPYSTGNKDDTIRIAYIGDSWAFLHNNHDCIIAKIIEDRLHMPAMVYTYGTCGLTSKEIYESLFFDSKLKLLFNKRGFNYCFISAGINDTYRKMSTEYYKKSMDGIIQFLLANNIRPIILEIPNYNILKAFTQRNCLRKMQLRINMIINKTSLDCKQSFRDALDSLIIKSNYRNKISIIRYPMWNNNYSKDLKHLYLEDGMHLNSNGYSKLDSIIAIEITDTYH